MFEWRICSLYSVVHHTSYICQKKTKYTTVSAWWTCLNDIIKTKLNGRGISAGASRGRTKEKVFVWWDADFVRFSSLFDNPWTLSPSHIVRKIFSFSIKSCVFLNPLKDIELWENQTHTLCFRRRQPERKLSGAFFFGQIENIC